MMEYIGNPSGYVELPSPAKEAKQIDDAAAAIYQRFARFGQEYEDREAGALAYQAAGYTGTLSPAVAAFATPAGLTPTVATNLILTQAAQLRGAVGLIGAQRMRKYEVMRATETDVQSITADILGRINAIGAAIG